MAGKTKRRVAEGGEVSRPVTPATPTSPNGFPTSQLKGHLGLKSSPYAPTDCKLVNQYMVVDHMCAHYKKVTSAKSCVDTTPPKSWMASQKVRDRVRRQVLQNHVKRREAWTNQPLSARASSRASSDIDRKEMLAMLESLDNDEGYDIPDARVNSTYDTLEVHPPQSQQDSPGLNNNDYNKLRTDVDERDMKLINKIVDDNSVSPSKYRSPHSVMSNIPGNQRGKGSRHGSGSTKVHLPADRMGATYSRAYAVTYRQPAMGKAPVTPRGKGGDLLETHAHKFGEEKPFQPRTLKTKVNSKLSEFKHYNPPKRPESDGLQNGSNEHSGQNSVSKSSMKKPQQGYGVPSRATGGMRPVTPMTDSVDWANETIISRDMNHHTPTGIPRLDISLDQDHMMWLKEQSKKAHVRSTIRRRSSRSDLGSEAGTMHGMGSTQGMGSMRSMADTQRSALMNQTQNQEMLTKTVKNYRTAQLNNEEEELRYLEFISEVTNDVLDRGIFTNRVLKQVFAMHVERRKYDLKVSRMRGMLEDLRRDLGIPPENEDEDEKFGLATTREWTTEELATVSTTTTQVMNGTRDVESSFNNLNLENKYGSERNENNSSTAAAISQKRPMPKLQKSGRPPLPRPHPRSRGHSGSMGSSSFTSPYNSIEVKEEQPIAAENSLGVSMEVTLKDDVFGDTLISEPDNYQNTNNAERRVTVQVESDLDQDDLHQAYADTLKTDEETEEWEEDTPRPTPRVRKPISQNKNGEPTHGISVSNAADKDSELGDNTARATDHDSVFGDNTSRTTPRDSIQDNYTSRTDEFSSHSDDDSLHPEEPLAIQESDRQIPGYDELDRHSQSDKDALPSPKTDPPAPTPRKRSSIGLGKTMGFSRLDSYDEAKSTLKTEEAKSTARTEEYTSESIDVSDLDDEYDDNF